MIEAGAFWVKRKQTIERFRLNPALNLEANTTEGRDSKTH
jgi:hypothetical protein